MKLKVISLAALTLVQLPGLQSEALAQATAFTYQGRLAESGAPVSGVQDFEFRLFTSSSGAVQVGSTLLANDLAVSNGLFTTTLDFGAAVFPGAERFLQIAVRPGASTGAYIDLSPRQPITATPYAVKALEAAGLPAGAVSAAMLANGAVTGAKLGSGAVTADKIADGTITVGDVNLASFSTNFWNTSGNAGTSPSTHFLGTTDNQPVEIRANTRRALRLEPTADSANVIGGNASNVVSAGVVGAVIAGGGANGGNHNRVEADHAAVVGGLGNVAAGAQSVIGGGRGNIAGGTRAVVGGGLFNQALGFASVVAGGNANAATNNWSTIGGGADNLASGYASVIPGGINNTASANFTAAMGYRAKANHNGAFVWADAQEADFSSTGTNQFLIRATGGVGINTSNPNGAALAVDGTVRATAFIGGDGANVISNGVVGGNIGGGGNAGFPNRVGGNYATVPGGLGNTASGLASMAMGLYNSANGYASLATGQESLASGSYSTAMGYKAGATGAYSTALGRETWAMGSDSIAMGVATTASGEISTALGLSTTASGDFSTASGYNSVASGESSTALGRSTASGKSSTALGAFTAAAGESSTALGRSTFADGFAATAMGHRARALHDGSFVWADQQEADFDSTAANQFSLRASGGVRFQTGGAGLTVDGQFKGGHAGNVISNGVVGGFIGGGGNAAFYPNRVGGDYASVLGGEGNTASGDYSTAMGRVTTAREYASTAMGHGTRASGFASTAMGDNTSASGLTSTAMGRSTAATNTSSTAMGHGTLAGGVASTAMGQSTRASGDYSTAMGYSARALHRGSFVWADQQEADFDSTAVNQFSLRASGGVRLANDTSLNFGNQTRQMINLWGTEYGIGVQSDATYFRTGNEFMWYRGGSHSDTFGDSGGGDQVMRLGSTGNLVLAGTLSQGSDRHIKQDFTAVNPQEVLEKVAALSIQTWTYTNNAGVRHLGPVAQDFHAAFGLNGEDDKHIATVDADGVALAAIQGLNQKLEVTQRENASLKERVEKLESLLQKLVTE